MMSSKYNSQSPHLCNHCDARFTRLEHLQRHISSFHRSCSPKPHECEYCGKRFMRKDVLIRHYQSCRVVKETSSRPPEHQSPSQMQALDDDNGVRPSSTIQRGTSQIGDGQLTAPSNQPPVVGQHRELNGDESDARIDPTLPPERRRSGPNRRGRYVSNACINCQKRKVKCSGEASCSQCSSAELTCMYNRGRKRRKTASREEEPTVSETPGGIFSTALQATGTSNISESLVQILDRIANLEQQHAVFQNQILSSDPGDSLDSLSVSSEGGRHLRTDDEILCPPLEGVFHGPTNLMQSIKILNTTVAHDEVDFQDISFPPEEPQAFLTMDVPFRAEGWKIDIVEKEARKEGEESLRHSINTFFEFLNPHYPCINENEFRHQFECFWDNRPCFSSLADRYQFVALVSLIDAEVRLLTGHWAVGQPVPAWQGFLRAETILSRILCLGNGNVMTIQCLLVKACYLLYLERGTAAYDTVNRAVRVCFHLGIHDEATWTRCSPFERVMRQRVFWTCFYLERSLALNCGFPYILRESDFNVSLPDNYDDKAMFPDQPLPDTCESRSFAPNVSASAKWGHIVAEIWDAVFSTKAPKPTSQEVLVSLDARLQYIMTHLPLDLQYHPEHHQRPTQEGEPERPLYILRQRKILHLRMNQLRLLLRQQSFLNRQHSTSLAVNESLEIIESSLEAIRENFEDSSVPTGRFSVVFYLVGAVVPLVCIICNSENSPELRSRAILRYHTSLDILHSLSPTFGVARNVLARLQRIIDTARRVIDRFQISSEPLPLDPVILDLDQHCDLEILGAGGSCPPDASDKQMFQLLCDNTQTFGQSLMSGMEDVDMFWMNDMLASS